MEPLVLETQSDSLLATSFLPEPDFLLVEPVADDAILEKARERGNVVLECSADPPETALGHRIRTAKLGGLLLLVQTMVTHSYRRAIRDLPEHVRKTLDTANGGDMDVIIPASAGSFKVVFEAAKPADLFGNGELARGLHRMDAVFESAKSPNTAKEQLDAHRGHLAGSYIRLMKFLTENGMNFQYSWAEPTSSNSHHNAVSNAAAERLSILLEETNLTTEAVTFIGELERAQRDTGNWTLLTDEGQRTGRTADGGPSLNGLEVGREYTF